MTISESNLQNAYILAKERYAALGVDVDQAIARLEEIAISLHCWQGDDVSGFENPDAEIGGGLAITGNYPGKQIFQCEKGDPMMMQWGPLDFSWKLINGEI